MSALGAALLFAAPVQSQTTPLDRRVALSVSDVPLRDALDRLAAAAHVRFSYSSDALPLDRIVRTSADSATVRQILIELLAGVDVTPVAAASDQIVLSPGGATTKDTSRAIAPVALNPVVVTGTKGVSAARAITSSTTVLGASDFDRFGSMTLASMLDGGVPGTWAWDLSSLAGFTRYASVRGASSLGNMYPKIYVDGITVANPLLMSTINPETVDRVEIIRGPQGAALYGSDAISGVVNIVTRHEGPVGGPRWRIRSGVGTTSSDFGNSSLTQNHSLTFSGGTPLRSGHASIGIATVGDYFEHSASRRLSGDAGFRRVGGRSILTGTAQFSTSNIGVAQLHDTTLATRNVQQSAGTGLLAPHVDDDAQLNTYTLGLTMRTANGSRLTHTFTAGIDGYRLQNFGTEFSPLPASVDSALRAANGGADRTTARITSAIRMGDDRRTAATMSVALEHSALRQESPLVRTSSGGFRVGDSNSSSWLNDAGIVMQLDAVSHRQLYLTAGLRLEHNDGYISKARTTALPMIGLSYVQDFEGATIKWRGAFGRGVRSPRAAPRESMMGGMRQSIAADGLEPERQSGIEGGVDLYIGKSLSWQFTAFDQTASGLIQQVVTLDPTRVDAQGRSPAVAFEYQNVGSISNRGWEAQAKARYGELHLSLAYAAVSSIVHAINSGYSGELREGDRVLGVPARTVAGSITWTHGPWTTSVGLSRAFDWMEYDRANLASAYRRNGGPLFGDDLRGFWRDYEGQYRMRASIARTLSPTTSLFLQGENLTGVQRNEPDNVTILPGRTVVGGIRITRF